MANPLIPQYYQIKQTIKRRIVNNEIGKGEKLPTENELAAQFEVNRLTVRQAIAQLIQEGLLTSKRGSGIYVTNDQKLINSLSVEMTGVMDGVFFQVQKSKTKFVKLEEINPPPHVSKNLKLDENQNVIKIIRTRYLKKEPFIYVINYLPLNIGKKLHKQKLYEKPLLQLLEQDLKLEFKNAYQTIEASFCTQEVSDRLGTPVGTPMLYVERILYSQKFFPILISNIWYRGDLFKYIIRLKNIKKKNKNIWIYQ